MIFDDVEFVIVVLRVGKCIDILKYHAGRLRVEGGHLSSLFSCKGSLRYGDIQA